MEDKFNKGRDYIVKKYTLALKVCIAEVTGQEYEVEFISVDDPSQLRSNKADNSNNKLVNNEIINLIKEKENAIRNQEFEKASSLRDDEANMKDRIREVSEDWRRQNDANKPTVTEEDVAQVIAIMTGVPVTKLTEGESERLLRLENTLHERVIGQSDAVVAISKAIRRARVGLKSPNRPIGSFIFSGPTGVGKTELAKTIAAEFSMTEPTAILVFKCLKTTKIHNPINKALKTLKTCQTITEVWIVFFLVLKL